jgi:hypothetical protein
LFLGDDFLLRVGLDLLLAGGLIPLLVVDKDVEAGDPEIPSVLIIGFEFVDTFLGDEFELEGANDFDVFYFLDRDAFFDFL